MPFTTRKTKGGRVRQRTKGGKLLAKGTSKTKAAAQRRIIRERERRRR